MQENKQNAQWTDILHQEKIEVEIPAYAQCAAIGKLVVYYFMWYEPANQNTSQETHHGQENRSCQKVEDIKQRLFKEIQCATCGT